MVVSESGSDRPLIVDCRSRREVEDGMKSQKPRGCRKVETNEGESNVF